VADRAHIRWTGTLVGNLTTLEARQMAAIAASAGLIASEGEGYMRSNAPWTDRTGNARNGLRGEAQVEGGGRRATVVYYHSVSYGIWLEVANSGTYQIINPTLQVMGPRWMSLLAGMIWSGR